MDKQGGYSPEVRDPAVRLVAGWSMSERMTRELVLEALDMAVGRRPGPGLLHHSDRGGQHACGDYQRALTTHGMLCSMSRALKTEMVRHGEYQTRWEAKADIFEYIEVLYNRGRGRSALGLIAPAEYEILNLAA